MFRVIEVTLLSRSPRPTGSTTGNERAVIRRFAARINALGPLYRPSATLKWRVLEEVKLVAQHLDGSAEAGSASGYDRHILYEQANRWSLAVIVLRPGQKTQPHAHEGWGCAVTIQGIERNRSFFRDAAGNLVLIGERDFTPGMGYLFEAEDVHQPVGADPRQVTVALHFLVDETPNRSI